MTEDAEQRRGVRGRWTGKEIKMLEKGSHRPREINPKVVVGGGVGLNAQEVEIGWRALAGGLL